jgi:hypothetical protein
LKLEEDMTGLRFEAELPDTQEARDLYTLVERGDVDQMSFAFRVIRQKWSSDRSERTLTEVSLADGDVSVVTYPAYAATSVEARQKLDSLIQELKEGREINPESIKMVKDYLEDLLEENEEDEMEDEIEDEVDDVEDAGYDKDKDKEDSGYDKDKEDEKKRTISLRLAKAIISNVK